MPPHTMKRFLFSLLFLFLSSTLHSQNTIENEPVHIVFKEISLPKIDTYINRHIEKEVIPGGVFLIAKKNQIIYLKSFGYNDQSEKQLYKNDDIFRIASMTKAITVTAILQLFEQGKLELDDPVSKFIPAFNHMKVLVDSNKNDSTYTTVDAIRPITIKHLLTHTSGIYYGQFVKGNLRLSYEKQGLMRTGLFDKNRNTEQVVDQIAQAPLAFQPGTKWIYGLNMDILGRIVEIASQQNLSDYFHEHIFSPLNMTDTYFYIPKEKQDRLVKLHIYEDQILEILKPYPELNYPKFDAQNFYAGGGGLSSTALDYAKFCLALINNGALDVNRILSSNSIALMNTDQIPELKKNHAGFTKMKGIGFGLGFGLITDERPLLWPFSEDTFYWGGAFNTKFFIDPKEEVVFVGLTQIYPFKHDKFWNGLYKEVYKSLENQ